MKILFKEGKYDLVSNDLEADKKVKQFGWRYATRSEWKTNVRDVKKNRSLERLSGGEKFMDESNLTVVVSKHEQTKERRAKKHSKIKEKQR